MRGAALRQALRRGEDPGEPGPGSFWRITDILLLDEPTNHLDLRATEWLEEYLDKFKGTVLTVSHDRYFLDKVVNRIVEIQGGKAEFYSGNYSFYVVEKERRYEEKLRQYEKEQAKIEQLEKAAEQMRIWAYSGMDKTFKRVKSMEKRIERMRTTDRPTKERKMEVRFGEREFRGDEVLTIKGLTKSFGDRTLFSNLGLEVVGGERIALLGDNGSGKTTLLKILLGEEEPDAGKVRMGPTVKVGYLPSTSTLTTRSGTWWTPSFTSRTVPPRPPGTGWRPSSSGGRTYSSPCPPCPAESRAACGCACSWTRRSTS